MSPTTQGPTNTLGHDWDSLQWLDGTFIRDCLADASSPAGRSFELLLYAANHTARSIGWPNATVHELRCRARAAGLRWLGKYGRRDELRAALLVLNMGSAWVVN